MSYSRNHVELIGHLGADPETRSMPSGDAVTNIRVATSYKSKEREYTEWHSVVFFGRLAEIAAEYLHKGSHVFIEGGLRTRKWKDKQGNDRYSTEVVANQLGMLGGPREGAPRRESAPAKPEERSQRSPDLDDQIPF